MRSMLAAHLDNLLFLLLIAVAVLFQFLAKAAGKSAKDQTKRTPTPPTPKPIPRASTESDEDRIRKLLEALGQPATSRPPPPVAPRTDVPPRPLAPVQPPMSPLSQLRREKPRKREMIPEGIPAPRPVSGPARMIAPTFEVDEGSLPIEQAPTVRAARRAIAKIEEARTEIVTLLASKSGLRDAIILREILGPPLGLRAIDRTLAVAAARPASNSVH